MVIMRNFLLSKERRKYVRIVWKKILLLIDVKNLTINNQKKKKRLNNLTHKIKSNQHKVEFQRTQKFIILK